jgi:hypothetical protein
MLQAEQIEELISLVAAMDRPTLIRLIAEHRGSFPLDFTPQFLNSVDLERLRHTFVAVCLQCQRLPPSPTPAAA